MKLNMLFENDSWFYDEGYQEATQIMAQRLEAHNTIDGLNALKNDLYWINHYKKSIYEDIKKISRRADLSYDQKNNMINKLELFSSEFVKLHTRAIEVLNTIKASSN